MTLANERETLKLKSLARQREEYLALVRKAARGGGLYVALTEEERDRAIVLATAIGLPEHHSIADDVRRIELEQERKAAVKDAEIETAMIPTVSESQQEIDDADQVIRDQLENVLLPYKREQLELIARRKAAEDRLRQARHELSLVYSSARHLEGHG